VHAGPVGGGLPLSYLRMAVVSVVLVLAALPLFDRRDIVTR
jgi:hypothetical protein